MSNTRTCWMFGLTMFAVLALAACAPRELSSDTGLLIESLSTPTDARPFTPDVSPSPTKETVPSPEQSSTVAGYPYPSLTPQPTFTPPPTPTPIVLPPLPTIAPPGPFSDMRVLYSNNLKPGYRSIRFDGTDEILLPPWWLSDPLAEELGGPCPGFSHNVSADGARMLHLFCKSVMPEVEIPTSIWTSAPDGSNSQVLLTYTDEWVPLDPIWSPDSRQIAYYRAYLSGSLKDGVAFSSLELWIMNADGTDPRQVVSDPAFRLEIFGWGAILFRWLHNGYVYFVNYDEGLYAVDPASGNLYQLASGIDPLALYSNLSPDGLHIVTARDLSAPVIERMGLIPLGVPGEVEEWSSDGAYLLYRQYDELWLHDVATGSERRLPSERTLNRASLSPDGRFLAYQTEAGIFVLDIERDVNWLAVSDPHSPVTGRKVLQFFGWIPVR